MIGHSPSWFFHRFSAGHGRSIRRVLLQLNLVNRQTFSMDSMYTLADFSFPKSVQELTCNCCLAHRHTLAMYIPCTLFTRFWKLQIKICHDNPWNIHDISDSHTTNRTNRTIRKREAQMLRDRQRQNRTGRIMGLLQNLEPKWKHRWVTYPTSKYAGEYAGESPLSPYCPH